jgi:hypothetical protein
LSVIRALNNINFKGNGGIALVASINVEPWRSYKKGNVCQLGMNSFQRGIIN